MTIHASAAAGFERGAAAYERGRPTYTAETVDLIVDRLDIGPARVVVDVAAGTGKLTRMLTPTGASVLAVEPVAAMRGLLRQVAPDAHAVGAIAESLPLAARSVDAVTVAQAFHWFDAEAALREFDRVLRPGACAALVWNRRDLEQPLQAEINRIIQPHRNRAPSYSGGGWRLALDAAGVFRVAEEHHLPFEQELEVSGLVDRVASTSVIAALDDRGRDEVAAAVRAVGESQEGRIRLRYIADVFICERR